MKTDSNAVKRGLQTATETVVAEVKHLGSALILPEGLSKEQAVAVLERMIVQEEEEVRVGANINAFVYDGAYAFQQALLAKYGAVVQTKGFWGTPPATIGVTIGIDDKGHPRVVQVPWGRVLLPGIEGYLECGTHRKNGVTMFQISGVVKKKHEKEVKDIIEATAAYVRENSIYRGGAFRIRFTDDDGDPLPMPEPAFIDLRDRTPVILSEDVQHVVDVNIFTPIRNTEELRKHKIPLKRGVLMEGRFGVGKTLIAFSTAREAIENGWTFIYCEKPNDFPEVLRFASQYYPAVVFCEDIDRLQSGQNRTLEGDELLNIIDGVDTKGAEIMVILTTNDLEQINQAMLRPGRLDAVISISPPDAKAVTRFIQLFGAGLVDPKEDLKEVSEMLAGQLASVVREVVERSKLAALRKSTDGKNIRITADDLKVSAFQMARQLELLRPKSKDTRSEIVKAATILANGDISREEAMSMMMAGSEDY